MRMYDIIKKKRDGGELSDEEIAFFVHGITAREIPDYQISALLMAIFFRGMTERETTSLTLNIAASGDRIELNIDGIRADKHSTGGVGDKTSLVVIPIVASLGIKVAKMSGRGLGHTGGTIDKLQAISGFDTDISSEKLQMIVNNVGAAIVGQTGSLAPADKLLYALRDVTATVDSIPLITSSIMGKKLAMGDDVIVLDVKCGSGAFMKNIEDSRSLASLCVKTGKRAGKKISALITDMDQPLGYAIGNSLEVIEAIDALSGRGQSDLVELSLALSSEILFLCGKGSREFCLELCKEALDSGKAKDAFAKMVSAQGGDSRYVYDTRLFKSAEFSRSVISEKSGYVQKLDAEKLGLVALTLGAGRNKIDDDIDFSAGIILNKKKGDYIEKGEALMTLYSDKDDFLAAINSARQAVTVGEVKPQPNPIVLSRVE